MGEMIYNQIDHIEVIFRHDIQNWFIFPLKFSLKTKMDSLVLFMGI